MVPYIPGFSRLGPVDRFELDGERRRVRDNGDEKLDGSC